MPCGWQWKNMIHWLLWDKMLQIMVGFSKLPKDLLRNLAKTVCAIPQLQKVVFWVRDMAWQFEK